MLGITEMDKHTFLMSKSTRIEEMCITFNVIQTNDSKVLTLFLGFFFFFLIDGHMRMNNE